MKRPVTLFLVGSVFAVASFWVWWCFPVAIVWFVWAVMISGNDRADRSQTLGWMEGRTVMTRSFIEAMNRGLTVAEWLEAEAERTDNYLQARMTPKEWSRHQTELAALMAKYHGPKSPE